jgi:hypothetical protein
VAARLWLGGMLVGVVGVVVAVTMPTRWRADPPLHGVSVWLRWLCVWLGLAGWDLLGSPSC